MSRVFLISACLVISRALCWGSVLFDFESGLQGWRSVGDNQRVEVVQEGAVQGRRSLALVCEGATDGWLAVTQEFDWRGAGTLSFTVSLPEDASVSCLVVPYVKDRDYNWYEAESQQVYAGMTRVCTVDISEFSTEWKPFGHLNAWDGYVKQQIREFGLRCYFSRPYSGRIYLDGVETAAELPVPVSFLSQFRVNSARVPKFGRYEASFTLPASFANPYDPDEVSIDGQFRCPSGRTVSIPAFLFHDYVRSLEIDGEHLYPVGAHEWRVRFTPTETGTYSWTLTVSAGGQRVSFACPEFEAVPSDNPGFLRFDRHDPNWLSFDTGGFFRPLGLTLRSPDDQWQPYPYEFPVEKGRGTFTYDRYFRKMGEAGMNYARVWMAAWWHGIEWSPSYASHYQGLGRYSQQGAWQLDYTLGLAEQNRIYLTLVLLNHGTLVCDPARPTVEWWDNPYNELNGGMLRTPSEFFTNSEAQRYIKRRLRYIVGRWAYSPSIAFWELWNEVDLTDSYNTANVAAWHTRICPYLRSLDPWEHPITTHNCRPQNDPAVWALPVIETIVGNAYNASVVSAVRDFLVQRLPYRKPVMVNEFGVGGNAAVLRRNLHAGIWASSVLPFFGTAIFWWWPFVDYYDLYRAEYAPLAAFLRNEDFRGMNLRMAECRIAGGPHASRCGAVGMQNDEVGYFWVYDTFLFDAVSAAPTVNLQGQGLSLVVSSFREGVYLVEYWDTARGVIASSEQRAFAGKEQTLPLPAFSTDIAVKIRRVKE